MGRTQLIIVAVVVGWMASALRAEDKVQAPTTPPTVAQLQQQIALKDQQLQWFSQILALTQAKLDAMTKYYQADDQLTQLKNVMGQGQPTAPLQPLSKEK